MSDTAVTVFVRPAHYPWLITTALDVMFESDLDFDMPSFSTLDPRAGELDLDGPDRYQAKLEIKNRLKDIDVDLLEVRTSF